MNHTAIVNLRSAFGCCWKDEFSVRKGRLKRGRIWEFGRQKWWRKHLGIGASTVKNDEGLFVCEAGSDDEWFWEGG